MPRYAWTGCASILAAGLLAAGCGDTGDESVVTETDTLAGPAGETVTVELQPVGGSGAAGTATLTAAGVDGTRVTVELAEPVEDAQPPHLHPGVCGEDLGPSPAFPFEGEPAEGETLSSVVESPLDQLRVGDFAVTVHVEREAIETIVACGTIPPA